jgi:hypothetical protein
MIKTTKQTRGIAILSGLLILSLLPFLLLTVFCNPALDDYCYAAGTLKYGFFNAQSDQFNNWSGRYFSTAILCLNPIVFGHFSGYKLAALLIILLTFLSVFFFVTGLLKSSASFAERVIAASFITSLFSNNAPDITEAYYWMPGSISYQLPNILILFMLALVIKASDSAGIIQAGLLTLCSILIIAIVGSSETSMIFLLFLLCTVMTKAFLMKSKNRRLWLLLFVITSLCSCVVIFAPGNAVRSHNFPDNHRLFFSVGMALVQEIRFIVIWVSAPAFVLSTMLFVPIAARLAAKTRLLKDHLYIHPYSSTVLLFALVFFGFFPTFWAIGMLGQYRTVNTAYLFFILGWFINVVIWVGYFKEKGKEMKLELPVYVYWICLPLIALALLSTNNTKSAFTDLIDNRAYHYDQEMSSRHLQFERCAREKRGDCQIQTISDLPETVANFDYVTKINCEEEYWQLKTASAGNP